MIEHGAIFMVRYLFSCEYKFPNLKGSANILRLSNSSHIYALIIP